ncbi:MAG: prepilin-type N-terminal cleavage/methylation domain-containing protein [Candidatus Omnitrophota bacterium]|nr:prepilin-type N-terminal cleavage/methylation domain-containing protein [Candidatus Omnitrophota bacterium]
MRFNNAMKKNGFTLIEIMLSVTLITIISLGMFAAYVGVWRFFHRARHRLQASNFSREVLDKLRSDYGYNATDYPDMAVGVHDALDIGISAQGEIASRTTAFQYTVTEPQANGYKKIVATFTWDEPAF